MNVTVSRKTILKASNTIYFKPNFTGSRDCNSTISIVIVTSDKYYYLKDHLGSIRLTVNESG